MAEKLQQPPETAQAPPKEPETALPSHTRPAPDRGGPRTARRQGAHPARKDISPGDNLIFVGKKPAMSYVMAVLTQLNSDQKEIHVRARGQSISKAVDVIEIVRNKFVRDLKYGVTFETASLQNRENRAVNVSVIDIKVER